MWWTRYRKKALSISAFKFCSDRMAQSIGKTFQGFWLAWKNAIIKMKSLTPIFWLIILEKVKFVPSFKEPKNKKKINVFEVKLFFVQNGQRVLYMSSSFWLLGVKSRDFFSSWERNNFLQNWPNSQITQLCKQFFLSQHEKNRVIQQPKTRGGCRAPKLELKRYLYLIT